MPNVNLYELPELQEINRLPMHGAGVPRSESGDELKISLDGEWDFAWQKSAANLPGNWLNELAQFNWDKITVPSNWTCSGKYDLPIYTNVQMPFKNSPPCVPRENSLGIYRTRFNWQDNWQNRRVILHIGGAESYLEVYINGQFAGMGKDTRLPSEFDLTPFLKKDSANELICKVIRFSDSSYIEDQDQWWMAGIYRSVYLYTTDTAWIEDLFVNGDWQLENQTGKLKVSVKVNFDGSSFSPVGPEKPVSIDCRLLDALGKTIWQEQKEVSPFFRDQLYRTEFEAANLNVAPWSAERPVLYTLKTTLLDDSKNVIERRQHRTGFRNIRISGRDLLFNGKRVLIRGVNRHEHNPNTGKTISYEQMLSEIKLLKQFNFNAVRTSHYPDNHLWYDLCDEYGIYIVDEANAEAHANYHSLCRDPRWKNAFVDRCRRMVLRDRSHCCIFSWSTGNESGNGENHIAAIDAIRQLDNSRIIHHEGEVKQFWYQNHNAQKFPHCRYNELFNPMYPHIDTLKSYSDDPDNQRPAVLSEYAHAMGNSGGGLGEYWDLFYSKFALQGGFIWDWVDQGLYRTTANGKRQLAYGGDFNETIHDFDFCCNGMLAADLSLHPVMYEFRHLAQEIKVAPGGTANEFILTNRRFFTCHDNCIGKWVLSVNGNPVCGGDVPDFSSLEPQKSMTFCLDYNGFEPDKGDTVTATFRFTLKNSTPWADAGQLIAHDQVILDLPAKEKNATLSSTVAAQLLLTEQTGRLICGDTEISVELSSGKLSLKNKNELISPDFCRCNVFRCPTDNDGIRGWTNQDHKPMSHWFKAGLDKLNSSETTVIPLPDGNGLEITQQISGQNGFAMQFVRRIIALTDGTIQVKLDYQLSEDAPSMPRIGIISTLTAGFNQVEYFGCGPWENYIDRRRSAMLGRYRSSVRELSESNYILPQESGNRTGTKELQISNGRCIAVFSSAGSFEFSTRHNTANELLQARHQEELTGHPEVFLTMDTIQRGLGTGSCGPQPFAPYVIDAKEFHWEFFLKI